MEGKRVYIASKLGRMESRVNALKERLVAAGYEMLFDWTEVTVPKPFRDHVPEASGVADEMALAVMRCDILVVLCAEGGIGYHIETGGTLIASIILSRVLGQKRKRIYVIGEGNERSIFYFHELVTRLPDEDSLMRELEG